MTIAELNIKLNALEQRIAKAKKDQSIREDLCRQIATLTEAQAREEAKLQKENNDVAALKSISPTALFAKLSGRFQEKMEKEEREAVAAKLRYDMAKDAVERMDFKLRTLDGEREDLQQLHREYDTLLAEKEALLRQSGSSVAPELIAIQRELASCTAMQKEVDEALSAAHHALGKLDEMAKELQSASDLGTWDMLGGGLFVTLAKHEHMDSAQVIGGQVSEALSALRTELADVQVETLSGEITTSFLGMADIWFDGLFVDWMVQDQIHDAQRNMENVRQEVAQVTYNLEQQADTLQGQYDSLKAKQKDLLDNN